MAASYVSPVTGKNHGISPWEKDPDKHKQRRVDWYTKARLEAITHYGGRCACCGEEEYAFLCLDHHGGGGNQHRKSVTASALPAWLRRNGYPSGFRVLCHNCNFATANGKECPHAARRADDEGPGCTPGLVV